MPKHKGGKKGKRPDPRPARGRYAARFPTKLKARKIRNLVRCCGLDEDAARKQWEKTRVHLRMAKKVRGKAAAPPLPYWDMWEKRPRWAR